MTETGADNSVRPRRRFDLEERTFQFARRVREFARKLPRTICNMEDVKQVVRSSGSVGANYIEANESLSKKDFLNRIRISRKEAKEAAYWLRLLDTQENVALEREREALATEAKELMRIMSAIMRNSE
jgi:four helix bundle protein